MVKTVLITGAAKGIGLCCARGLKARGYRVIATARRPEDLQFLRQEGLEALPLDLNDSTSIQQFMTQLTTLTGNQLYALVNNAGYGQIGAVEDLSRSELRNQFETNVFGTLELTNHIIPILRKQGYGRIIMLSSVLGFVSMPYRGAYNASKYALEGLTDALRQELSTTGIQVSLIEPGPIESQFRTQAYELFLKTMANKSSPHHDVYANMLAGFQQLKRPPFMQSPEAVLKKLIHALESKQAKIRYYVTTPTYILAFLKWLLPARAMDWILRTIAAGE